MGNLVGATPTAMSNIAKPGCDTQCGNLTVEYPFGIGTGNGCSLDESFELTCNMTYDPPKLFIRTSNIEIYSISESEMRIYNPVGYRCYNETGHVTGDLNAWSSLYTSPFSFSQKNTFTVIGCDDFALIANEDSFTSGCLGLCSKASDLPSEHCVGIGCCQTTIPKGLKYYNATLFSFENHKGVVSFNRCGFAFIGEQGSFQFRGELDLNDPIEFYERTSSNVPSVVDWVLGGNRTCKTPTECKENSICIDDLDIGGYRCSCKEGYQGNPYLEPGCQEKPADCQKKCGNLTVEYPFGIGKGCSLDESFELTCDMTYNPPKLFIGSGNIDIYSISDTEMRLFNSVSYKCYDEFGYVTDNSSGQISLKNSPFSFSQKNKFNVIGCDDFAVITGEYGDDFTSGCLGLCTQASDLPNGSCSGAYGCCQTSIPKGLQFYKAEFFSLNNHTSVNSFNRCGFAFLGAEDGFQFVSANDSSNATEFYDRAYSVPIVVDWVVGGTQTCSQGNVCKGNSTCKDDADAGGYRCSCNQGYEGNPYIDLGCQDINECQRNILCYGECINTPGSYDCNCHRGYIGNATLKDGCRPVNNSAVLEISLGLVFGLLAIFCPRLLREGTLEHLQTVAELVKRCLNLLGEDRPTMREVSMELEGLKKFTTHPCGRPEESRSLTLEVEQSDLYDVPLMPYSSNEWESNSGITQMQFQENKLR
ncbi:hypothetical protein L2E82_21110 [Cichorium intybus]|uniref:Uncharacterized protein n=1 Tax=Cichorium intybus TaxID=13427 RepID=A0ACB9DV84_CICIN|nr:hypothetical protein L2E82_21110 [Cichorium intybus]